MLALPDTEVVSVPDGRAGARAGALNADPDVRYAVPNVRCGRRRADRPR